MQHMASVGLCCAGSWIGSKVVLWYHKIDKQVITIAQSPWVRVVSALTAMDIVLCHTICQPFLHWWVGPFCQALIVVSNLFSHDQFTALLGTHIVYHCIHHANKVLGGVSTLLLSFMTVTTCKVLADRISMLVLLHYPTMTLGSVLDCTVDHGESQSKL